MSYLFAFSYCSWGSQGKNTEVVCHSLLQWTTFFQTSPPSPVRLGWPHMAWLSFTELDKTVVLGSDWLVFCDHGLVCLPSDALSQHLPIGFLLPWTWGISSWLLQQSAAAAPDLGHGVALLSHRSWPWMWGNSSWPVLMMYSSPLVVMRVYSQGFHGHSKLFFPVKNLFLLFSSWKSVWISLLLKAVGFTHWQVKES